LTKKYSFSANDRIIWARCERLYAHFTKVKLVLKSTKKGKKYTFHHLCTAHLRTLRLKRCTFLAHFTDGNSFVKNKFFHFKKCKNALKCILHFYLAFALANFYFLIKSVIFFPKEVDCFAVHLFAFWPKVHF